MYIAYDRLNGSKTKGENMPLDELDLEAMHHDEAIEDADNAFNDASYLWDKEIKLSQHGINLIQRLIKDYIPEPDEQALVKELLKVIK